MKTRKIVKDHGVVIPKPVLGQLGLKEGDSVDLFVSKGKITVTPRKLPVREGWIADSKALVAAGESGLVWPEFGNDADKNWEWPAGRPAGSRRSVRRTARGRT